MAASRSCPPERPERYHEQHDRELPGREVRVKHPPEEAGRECGDTRGNAFMDAPTNYIANATQLDEVPGDLGALEFHQAQWKKQRQHPGRVLEHEALVGGGVRVGIGAVEPSVRGFPVNVEVLAVELGVVEGAFERADGQEDKQGVHDPQGYALVSSRYGRGTRVGPDFFHCFEANTDDREAKYQAGSEVRARREGALSWRSSRPQFNKRPSAGSGLSTMPDRRIWKPLAGK